MAWLLGAVRDTYLEEFILLMSLTSSLHNDIIFFSWEELQYTGAVLNPPMIEAVLIFPVFFLNNIDFTIYTYLILTSTNGSKN